MPDMATVRAWMERRAAADDRLYERYGKRLEAEHTGEYVAISDDGRTLLSDDELSLAMEAAKQFGSGTFALRRIGADAEIRWRRTAD